MPNIVVGVFDSGVGGLTSVNYLHKYSPFIDILFFPDYCNNPYGTKKIYELKQILRNIIMYFNKLKVSLIICACNTAGTQLKYMSSISNVLIFEPITITCNYIKKKYDPFFYRSKVLLLATDNTIDSGLYQNYLSSYQIIPLKAQILVDISEKRIEDSQVLETLLKNYVNKVSLVILGCTHFGYFIDRIQNILPRATIVESSKILSLSVSEYINYHYSIDTKIDGNIKTINID